MVNFKSIAATGTKDNRFVGLKILNNEVIFYYPATYNLSSDEKIKKNQLFSILRTIDLVNKKSEDFSSYYSNSNDMESFPIKSYLWMINDYLTYKKYINFEKKHTIGVKGKINWKKTMQSNPIISKGNIIYKDIISEHKNNVDNLLNEIYQYCAKESIDNLGSWLFNLNYDTKGIDYKKLFNKKKYINAINAELRQSFNDLVRLRLNTMKEIIQGLDDDLSETNELIYGVNSYHTVFEKLVDLMFSRLNDKDKNYFYPNSSWIFKSFISSKPFESSNLRPDTILINGNDVYILDAKYYRFGQTFKPDDMPDTASIEKQITYGEFVKSLCNDGEKYENIYNAFIMPYNKESKENPGISQYNNIEFIGIAKAKWSDKGKKDKFYKVGALLIDTKFLIDNYNNCNDNNICDELIRLIQENINFADND